MRSSFLATAFAAIFLNTIFTPLMSQTAQVTGSLHAFTMTDINGAEVPLGNFAGKVVVVVNVASKCGLTPQYEDLQNLYTQYADRGVVVLGFPANNFMGQEPGSNQDIQSFCTTNYGVTFPMFGKISVKGRDQHPLYQFLEEATGQDPTWNFHKYLVDREGKVIASVSPQTSVLSEGFIAQLEALLAE